MRRRGLLRDDGVTAAAVLLFGKEPQVMFPNAYVRVLKFRGTVRQTGERQQLIEDQTFDGTIDLQAVSTGVHSCPRPSAANGSQLGSQGNII